MQFYKLLGLWFYVDFFLNLSFYYNVVKYKHKYLNRHHISIRKTSLLYNVYEGVARRVPISNVRIESVGSTGRAVFTYQALV